LSSDLDAEHALVAETHEGDKEQAEEDEERGTFFGHCSLKSIETSS